MAKYLLKSECIQVDASELFIGIDAAKKRLAVAVVRRVGASLEVVLRRCIENTQADVRALCRSLQPAKLYAVYEAGPTGYSLLRWLTECDVDAFMTPPSLVPVASGDRVKTDKRDAVKLATLLAGAQLKRVQALTDERYADRSIVRARERSLEAQRRAVQQLKALVLFHGLAIDIDNAGLTKKKLEELETYGGCSEQLQWTLQREVTRYRAMHAEVLQGTLLVKKLASLERYKTELALLASIPGIATISGMAILVERGDRNFSSGEDFTSYCGLTPSEYSTGEKRRQGHITRQGNSLLRHTLVEAAWRWKQLDDGARRDFDELAKRLGSSKKAIVAMARRLALIIHAMLRDKKSYVAPAEASQAA